MTFLATRPRRGLLVRVLSPATFAAAVALALFGTASPAEALRARFTFDSADLRLTPGAHGATVELRGARVVGGEQDPALPMVVKSFYVPEGMEVSGVVVVPVRETRVASATTLRSRSERALDPADVTRPYPASALDPKSASIPASPGISLGVGLLGGFAIHSVALFPVRYAPATGELFFAQELDVELVMRSAPRQADLVRERRGTDSERVFGESVRLMVENPLDVPTFETPLGRSSGENGFTPLDLPSVTGSAVDMVIVTTPALSASFQTLATWKTKKGVRTVVRATDWIETNYPQGHDLTESIRLFLKDSYVKWGTQFALLGGDHSQVPPREAYNRFYFQGVGIPSDQYFACLEGNWNADGDDKFGEGAYQAQPGDLVDLYPDLFVGRAPVQTVAEANTFVTKSTTYEKSIPAAHVKVHGVFGEVLFPAAWEYGVDPPQSISLDGKTPCETLDAIVDPTWTRYKRYQSDNGQDRAICVADLQAGRHLLTVVGHGDAFKFSVGNGINPLIYVADVNALTNGNKLTYVVATACNPNQFDLECEGEAFITNPNGGAIAVSGPTREDFPLSANDYSVEMYDLAFNHGVSGFGAMNQLKRVPFVPISQTDSTPDRWSMFTSILMGDPELRFWTDDPTALLATHPSTIPLSTSSITVTITNAVAVPQADALVCVSDAAGTYSRGLTNGSGQVTLPLSSSTTGTLAVVATKRNFKPYEGSASLTTGSGAVLTLSSSTIDDDAVAPSNGNGDLRVDAGERVEIDFVARNAGNTTANSVNATPSIVAGSNAIFDVTYGGVADVNKVFIGKNRTHPATIPFTLDFGTPSIAYDGAPSFTFAPDSTFSDRGIFVWQDLEGWHLVWSSGDITVAVAGTVTTDGQVLSTAGLELENGGDVLSVNGPQTIVTFSGTTSATDLVDGFDLALADNTKLSIFGGAAALGNIAAGGTAAGTVTFDVANTAREGQVGYVSCTFTATAGGPWTDIVPIVFSGPSLEAISHVLNDATPPASGNGNGVAEVGETIQIIPSVLNRGSGAANSVDGLLTGVAGITIVDDLDSYGDITPLATDTGTNGYTFTITNVSGTSVTLTLTDSLNRDTVKAIDFVAPASPAGLDFRSTSSAITVFWNPNAEVDLAGYNVYRSTLVGGPYTKLSFELLRAGSRYVDDGLALGTTYFYKASAVDLSGNESVLTAELQAWTTQVQLPAWPKTANNSVFPSLAIADADNSGQGELYVGSRDFNMYVFDADGDEHPGFPFPTLSELWSTPALADLDKDGDLEVLFGSNDTHCYVLKNDGTPFFGANPALIDLPGIGEEIRSSVTVADVDRDAQLEIFFGTNLGTLYGFNHDGTPMIPGNGLLFTVPSTGPANIWGTIGVADLANDGTREIVFSSWNDSLYVITPTGARAPGFPRGASKDFKRGPVIGDIDADGTKEILAGNQDKNVYCYNHDGSNYMSGGIFATLPDSVVSAPSLANLDGDPQLEVVVGCLDGKIYAFNHDGSGFLQVGGLFATPDPTASYEDQKLTASVIIANVDGDSDFEIFVGNLNGNFYGFHHTGQLMAGFPIRTDLSIFSTAAAGDLDGNGDIEVAFASYDGSVNVLDFTGPATAAALPWPTQGQNNARTSVYGEAGPFQTGAGEVDVAVTDFALFQNEPNPFRGVTTIRFASPRESPMTLRVFDVGGRAVKTLVNGVTPAGRHTVTWDGRDEKGRPTSAGVYFYRLDGADESLTRKSIRLR